MKFLVSTAFYRLFEVAADSEEEAEDIIRATDDLDTLNIIGGEFEFLDVTPVEDRKEGEGD